MRRPLGRAVAPFAATALSSATNFAAGVLALLTGTTADFGKFSIAFAVVLLVIVFIRTALVEPLLSEGPVGTGVLPYTALVAMVPAAAVGVSWVVFGSDSLLLVALALPALLVQDVGRAALLHADRAPAAVASEVVWAVASGVAVAGWALAGMLSPLTVFAAWAVGGCASAMVIVAMAPRLLPHSRFSTVHETMRPLRRDALSTAFLHRVLGQVATIISAVVLGAVGFGELRAAVLLLTPLNPVIQATRVLALAPEGSVEQRQRRSRHRYGLLLIAIAAWSLVVFGAVALGSGLRLFRDIDGGLVAIVAVSLLFQVGGSSLEAGFRLAGRYRELTHRYVIWSPLSFLIVVGSAAWGPTGAAIGMAIAAAARCVALGIDRTPAGSRAHRDRRGFVALRPAAGPAGVTPAAVTRTTTRHDTVVLTVVVLAIIRPVRDGALAELANVAQLAAVLWAVWDVTRHLDAARRWLSNIYIWPPLTLAGASIAWSVAWRDSAAGMAELLGVSALPIVIMRRLPPRRRLVPLFAAFVAIGFANLVLLLSGRAGADVGDFSGLFDHKNELGRATLVIALGAVALMTLRQVPSLVGYGSLMLAAALAFNAGSGTAIIAIALTLLAVPIVRRRVRPIDARLFNAWVAIALSGVLVLIARAGRIDPLGVALRALGRDVEQNTVEVRTSLWRLVWQEVLDRPMLGHGVATFDLGDVSIWTGTRMTTWNVAQAHNGFLDTAYQLGLIGVATIVGLQILLLVRLLRAQRRFPELRPWFAAAASCIVLIWVTNITYSTLFGRLGVFWLVFSVLAVACADEIDRHISGTAPEPDRSEIAA